METIPAVIGDEYPIEIPVKFGRYDFVRTIGSGSFAVVALVTERGTNNQYACKICSRQLLIEKNIFDRFEREVRIMQSFRHPSLVSLLDVVFDANLIYLVMEYCFNGELFQVIADQGKLEEGLARKMFNQIVDGLTYVHARDIAHRDLKPENILLDHDMNAKITDFGFCHPVDSKQLLKTPCGSPYYAPPEIICNQPYDGKRSDLWSLGVVLYTMVTGALPWQDGNQVQLYQQIMDARFTIPRTLSPTLRDLISRLMRADPNDRPTIEEVKKHPWLNESQDDYGFACPTATTTRMSQVQPDVRASYSLKRPLIIRPTIGHSAAINTSSFGGMAKVQSLIRRVPPSSGKRRPLPGEVVVVRGNAQ